MTYTKKLTVPEIQGDCSGDIFKQLKATDKAHKVDVINWPEEFPYCPETYFKMAWNAKGLYFSWEVSEAHILAANTGITGNVWEDSCVEFFLAEEGADVYYNLECNPVGARLYGKNDANSKNPMPAEVIEAIEVSGSLPAHQPVDQIEGGQWTLDVFLPAELLPEGLLERGKRFRANFYKCGDATREVHFASWNPIAHATPNFHLPEFFGDVVLQ